MRIGGYSYWCSVMDVSSLRSRQRTRPQVDRSLHTRSLGARECSRCAGCQSVQHDSWMKRPAHYRINAPTVVQVEGPGGQREFTRATRNRDVVPTHGPNVPCSLPTRLHVAIPGSFHTRRLKADAAKVRLPLVWTRKRLRWRGPLSNERRRCRGNCCDTSESALNPGFPTAQTHGRRAGFLAILQSLRNPGSPHSARWSG